MRPRKKDGAEKPSGAAKPAVELAEGQRRCTHCKRPKSEKAFGPDRRDRSGLRSWCRTCDRLESNARRRTEAHQVWLEAYTDRPEVRERRRGKDRKRAPKRLGQKRQYRKTTWGKLVHCRQKARWRREQATDDKRREALTALIAQYDAELKRLRDAGLAPTASRERIPSTRRPDDRTKSP
jgi:CRISPR/Cas system-associated protein Cas10 (large subunit of type III CRISPR-Cas system)